MKNLLLFCGVALSAALFSCSGHKNNVQPTVYTPTLPIDSGWTFASTSYWSDEFDYTGTPDTSKWTYDLGGSGWGNNELEDYTKAASNVNVANGNLVITARKENVGGMNYTSARIVSKNAGSMKYGRVEVSAKMPSGRGTWPAIWMLPDKYVYGSWPNSGEIDIQEMVGYNPYVAYFTIHTQLYNGAIGTQKGGSTNIQTAYSDYHKYRLDWTPYAVSGYYDDNLVFSYVNVGAGSPSWPFDQSFHLLMNIAVGGNWGGAKGVDDSIFPQSMTVDYVRFYKMNPPAKK